MFLNIFRFLKRKYKTLKEIGKTNFQVSYPNVFLLEEKQTYRKNSYVL